MRSIHRQPTEAGLRTLVVTWDLATGEAVQKTTLDHGFLAASRDLDVVATQVPSPRLNTVAVWRLRGERGVELKCPRRVSAAAVSPDGKLVATTEVDPDSSPVRTTIRVWDSGTGRECWSVTIPRSITDTRYSSDGALLMIRGHIRTRTEFRDARTGEEKYKRIPALLTGR